MVYNTMPSYGQYGLTPSYGAYPQTQPLYTQAQPSYAQNQQTSAGIIWVDGEVGAKAYQLPGGWPPNTPLPLWDTNDTVIYLKSTNPMGMPNPLQKIHYRMEDQASGMSCAPAPAPTALPSGDYATKEDLEKLKDELRNAISDNVQTAGTVRKGGKGNESAL